MLKFNFKSMLSILLKVTMVFSLLIFTGMTSTAKPVEAASWKTLDKNWKYRVDKPLADGGKENSYHVHVEGKVGKKVIKGAETVTGGVSHKTTLTKSGVPKKIQDKVKATSEFKKGVAKQKELDKAKKNAKKKTWSQLVIDPTPIIVIAGVIGVTFYWLSLAKWKTFIFG